MRVRATVALAAGAALAALAAPAAVTQATAHTGLEASTPRHGATVARVPATVTLTFAGPLTRVDAVRVTRDGRGDLVRRARLDPRDARRVVVSLTRPGRRAQAARYRVVWRVRGADGHALRGVVAFRVRGR
ncbi:copper resistance CopC family protein [Miltoncostaea marina]|uniref:copper resistance CopC family protein n=1 Tax=Miltoncostaea marina TaxID=2843215 RepID=UPI001C3CEAF8|nr:copper resistance protein CopC [Miltoncostaea marina]